MVTAKSITIENNAGTGSKVGPQTEERARPTYTRHSEAETQTQKEIFKDTKEERHIIQDATAIRQVAKF